MMDLNLEIHREIAHSFVHDCIVIRVCFKNLDCDLPVNLNNLNNKANTHSGKFPDTINFTTKPHFDAYVLLTWMRARLGGKDNCPRENSHKGH